MMTLGEVLDHLKTMPRGAVIDGLDADAYSFRGYYERLAISPGEGVPADALYVYLVSLIGTTMEGWKGGQYLIEEDTLVHVAYEGDTGPMLVGFDGSFPVLEDEVW